MPPDCWKEVELERLIGAAEVGLEDAEEESENIDVGREPIIKGTVEPGRGIPVR